MGWHKLNCTIFVGLHCFLKVPLWALSCTVTMLILYETFFVCFCFSSSFMLDVLEGTWPCLHVFLFYGVDGVAPHCARAPAALLDKQCAREQVAAALLSLRTSSYHISHSGTCWVHRAMCIPCDPLWRCTALLETLDMLNKPIRPGPTLLHATSENTTWTFICTCIHTVTFN